MSDTHLVIAIVILLAAVGGFVFLSDMLMRNWRLMDRTKGSPFRRADDGASHRYGESHVSCLKECLDRYGRSVDRTSFCSQECRISAG